MNLLGVSQVTHEGNRYLGWPKPATAKVLCYQLTEGSLSPQPERQLEYVILSCYSCSNFSCCFPNNGASLAQHLFKVCILGFSTDLTLLGRKYRLHYKYMSFRECCIMRHEHCKLNQWVLVRFVSLKSCCNNVFRDCGSGLFVQLQSCVKYSFI